jgi:transcription antitermination factor NusG
MRPLRTLRSLKGAKPVTSLSPAWYALWTHSHCEQVVRDQLLAKGYYAFLPTVDRWSRRRGVRRLVPTPMFPGYLFIRHAMDRQSCSDVSGVRGLVRVLGAGWDQPAPVADDEVDAIERVTLARRPVLPYPYLTEGQRARIVAGPLSGLEGRLVEARSRQGLLVLSVELLQRSVAVVVDATEVTPA